MKHILKNIALLLLLHYCVISCAFALDIKYGLGFNSFETIQEQRTGLNLTPSRPFTFPDGFSLSFDVCFLSNFRFGYGYVFRIIGRNNQHVDFLLSETKIVVYHSLNKTIVDFSSEEVNITYDNYFPFDIQFDVKNNTLNILLNEKKVSVKNVSMDDFKEVNIIFGKCNYPQFQASDIPKMVIRDIRINDHKGTPVYHWTLSKHTQNGVYDELKRQYASVENPQWIINSYTSWKNHISFTASYKPQITYNPDANSIDVFDKNTFYKYNINSHLLKENKMNREIPNNYYYTNQFFYHPFRHSYYSYFDVEDVVNTYDSLTYTWKTTDKERLVAFYYHHNKVVLPFDSCLYAFGGYGHHKYNNVISKYDFKTRMWETLHFNGDQIRPRYLSGLGVIDENRVLIFGGYGSETGAQESSPQNYYDLYVVDLKERTIKKIWELSPPANNFVVANSIVVDAENQCFYALCFPQQQYNTTLFLGKFSIKKPEYEIFADSIPFAFEDIFSYADLFLNKAMGELTAVTSSLVTIKDSTAIVSVYTLGYPPLTESELYQDEEKTSPGFRFGTVFFVSLLLCICGVVYFSFRRFRKKKIAAVHTVEPPIDSLEKPGPLEKNKQMKITTEKQSILLFGGLKVINRDGGDITSEFSPLIKQLFLIILLNTLKDGKGISSIKLDETLWFDKSQESARNNRGVLLSRLRQLLDQVGFVNIENRNSIWKIELGDDVYCDYYEAVTLIKWLSDKENLTNENLQKFLTIVSRGEMLPNLQIDWIDPFKADFSNSLIDLLIDFTKQPGLKLSLQETIDIADAIFIHDSLNEDALRMKCKTLLKMGKNGLAKSVYNSFLKEYHVSLGINFGYSFEQIIP